MILQPRWQAEVPVCQLTFAAGDFGVQLPRTHVVCSLQTLCSRGFCFVTRGLPISALFLNCHGSAGHWDPGGLPHHHPSLLPRGSKKTNAGGWRGEEFSKAVPMLHVLL